MNSPLGFVSNFRGTSEGIFLGTLEEILGETSVEILGGTPEAIPEYF